MEEIHRIDGEPETYIGRLITDAIFCDNSLVLTFEDGTEIEIFDGVQFCCETRYMTTDDDAQSLVGHSLKSIEEKQGPDEAASDSIHETCFVEVKTDAGFITLTNHNEHNGYYGGFSLCIREHFTSPKKEI